MLNSFQSVKVSVDFFEFLSTEVKAATSQKRLMTTFMLRLGRKTLKFQKVISKNLKIGKLILVTLAASNFQELFLIKFDPKPT